MPKDPALSFHRRDNQGMVEDRRFEHSDRRAKGRGGRRDTDHGKPWYVRHRLWLAAASLVFVGWRRVKSLTRQS